MTDRCVSSPAESSSFAPSLSSRRDERFSYNYHIIHCKYKKVGTNLQTHCNPRPGPSLYLLLRDLYVLCKTLYCIVLHHLKFFFQLIVDKATKFGCSTTFCQCIRGHPGEWLTACVYSAGWVFYCLRNNFTWWESFSSQWSSFSSDNIVLIETWIFLDK